MKLGRTVWDFVHSRAYLRILMGPRGKGKTVAGYVALMRRAAELPADVRPLKVLCVRDTVTNLERTTMETLRELSRSHGWSVQWRNGDTEAVVGGDLVHLYFLGMDSDKDYNKIQGFGCGALWIEEPAPAYDVGGGLDPRVLGLGVTSLRQQGVDPFVILTMNPPDENHWVLQIAENLSGGAKPKLFKIPADEKTPFNDTPFRERAREVLEAAGYGSLIERLIEGKIGFAISGEPVTPEYSDELHLASRPLRIRTGYDIVRLWDFGLHPTCVWTQVVDTGEWNILGCVRGENIGLEQLIEGHVEPWQAKYLVDPGKFRFRDIGDPAGSIREQSNSERSAVRLLEEMLDASFEPGPVEWEARRQALKAVLSRTHRGRGIMQIDPDPGSGAKIVRHALRGGAHYKRDALGRVIETVDSMKRASGADSHPFDCMTYGAAVLFPVRERHERRPSLGLSGRRVAVGSHGWRPRDRGSTMVPFRTVRSKGGCNHSEWLAEFFRHMFLDQKGPYALDEQEPANLKLGLSDPARLIHGYLLHRVFAGLVNAIKPTIAPSRSVLSTALNLDCHLAL